MLKLTSLLVFPLCSIALQKARQAKNLTQGDLAKLINVTQKVIQDYESGKAVPVGNIINLLNRKLETVLPKMSGTEHSKHGDRWCKFCALSCSLVLFSSTARR